MTQLPVIACCSGLSLGSVYALIALGYTMVYGIAKMLNFAHGDIIMAGAFSIAVSAATRAGACPPVIAVLAGHGRSARCWASRSSAPAYQVPFGRPRPLAVLITAIGVSYLLQNVAQLVCGASDTELPHQRWAIGLALALGTGSVKHLG